MTEHSRCPHGDRILYHTTFMKEFGDHMELQRSFKLCQPCIVKVVEFIEALELA